MHYIDGFITPVPNANKEAYLKAARLAAKVFVEHGALEYVDSWGDAVPPGKQTSFPRAVELKEGETVCFSWIVWESKETRDAGMKKVMRDPRMQPGQTEVPFEQIFDHGRMIIGSFQMVARTRAE
ncbi:MAG: DUF1428 domain-containing protein [Gammaproteobacteria bacterium]|nr:DUF1428 domain-containing protein [Gammaproteobacteria bacterium]